MPRWIFPGGSYLLVMQPSQGEPIHLTGTYRQIEPPERLVYTWRWAQGVPDEVESVVTVEFEDLGGRTRITLVHGGFPEDSDIASYEFGWNAGLEKLNLHLRGGASGSQRPWASNSQGPK